MMKGQVNQYATLIYGWKEKKLTCNQIFNGIIHSLSSSSCSRTNSPNTHICFSST